MLFIASFLIVIILTATVISSLSFIGTKAVGALSIPETSVGTITEFNMKGFEELGL